MKKKLLMLSVLSLGISSMYAQIGINTATPQATLDVVGFPATASKLDGIIAPRITGDQLRAKTYTAAQTGAQVYVTAADTAPLGQTINVVTAGYYYFDGTVWIKQGGSAGALALDWHLTGNTDAEITTSAETLGNAPASANFFGTRGTTDNLVMITGNLVHAVLDTDGSLKGGNSNTASPFSTISWGTNNTISDVKSSNIALGRSNTVSAQAANFPGAAIGYNNSALSGAKAIGNTNFASGANTVVLGNNNGIAGTPVSGINVGNSNKNSGGFAFGTGNDVTVSNYAVGNNNTSSGAGGAMVVGFSGSSTTPDQTVYSNTTHVFSGSSGADVGVNMVPGLNLPDLEVSKGILIKGTAPTDPNSACTSSINEGAIRYNSTTKKHEGCNGTVWTALY